MGSYNIAFDYGKYTNFSYQRKERQLTISWEPPKEVEDPKFVKVFDELVTTSLEKLANDLKKGAETARTKLAEFDDQVTKLISKWQKSKEIVKKDLQSAQLLEKNLPKFVENLEEQRFKIFESQLDKMLDKAVLDLQAKIKSKMRIGKAKKVLKIVGYAVLFLAGTAVAVLATIASAGLAAPFIVAAVGSAVGAVGGFAGMVNNAKKAWSDGKNDSNALSDKAEAYAKAAKEFDEALVRMQSRTALKRRELEILNKEYAQLDKKITEMLNAPAGTPDEAMEKLKKIVEERKSLSATIDSLTKSEHQKAQLVEEAAKSKDYKAALEAAKKVPENYWEKVSDCCSNISSLLGSAGAALPKMV